MKVSSTVFLLHALNSSLVGGVYPFSRMKHSRILVDSQLKNHPAAHTMVIAANNLFTTLTSSRNVRALLLLDELEESQ